MTDHTLRKNIMQKLKLYVELDCAIWGNDKGQDHRVDGPAVVYSNGDTYWHLNGQYHREDGPAIVYSDGTKSWYLNDVEYSEEEYNAKIKTLR